MTRTISTFLAMTAAVLLSLPAMADEVKDEYGVITSPADGVHKLYKRAGKAYTYSSDNAQSQSGRVELVECEDGTVYIKDIISLFSNNTWVKGTRSGNTITVPTGQYLYDEEDTWGWDTYLYKLAWGAQTYDDWWEEYTKSIDNSKTEITFTVSDDVISLDGSDENSYIGVFRSTEYSSSATFRYGDFATVWTLDADYEPASTELDVAPADLAAGTWYTTGASGSTLFKRTVTVGFSGSEVYVQGLFTDFPEAWIKGTVDGTTATFKALQYLGQKSGKNVWLTGEGMENITMTYDADKQKLTAQGSIIATNSEEKVSAVATYTDLVLFAEDEKIDALPYSSALVSASDFLSFIVIDANGDGRTWGYTAANGVRYTYSGSNDGDDWLISPAVKLEAGKLYHFAIDAKSYGTRYTERMEVRLATEPTAEALAAGVSVLGATDVATGEYATFENEAVAVGETGYYHFGIHAISEADVYYLYVANLLVEAGAEGNAPDGVTELTVTQADGAVAVNVSFKAPAQTMDGTALTTNLTKIDVLRDGAVVKTFEDVLPGTELSFTDEDGLTYGAHKYQVIAYSAAGAGKKSEAEVFVTGVPVSVPADLAAATWNARYTNGSNTTKYTVTVGFSGDDIYVQGLFADFPEAWLKGTLSGTTYVFAQPQYLGVKNSRNIWMTSTDGDEEDFVDFKMSYDEGSQVLTAQNFLLANYELDEINYLTRLRNVVVQEEEFGEPAAETAANVDELPYTNALNTQALFGDFGVLDVNGDGSTWKWSSQNSAPYYNFGFDDDADDWFISPGIRLEAGKKYHFAIDAKRGSSSQQLEVKLAADAKAGKLTSGIVVLPSTSLTTTYTTYENTEVTVSETGYYHFGIHSFTDAWSNIYVQNFLVEVGVEETAPAAVTDLAVVQAGEELAVEVSFTAPATDLGGNALAGDLTKVEVLRDEAVVKTFEAVAPGAALSFTDDADLSVGTHSYVVVAYNESGAGAKSDEAAVFVTGTLTVPYVADLRDQNTYDLFTVLDNNADGFTWKWGSTSKGARYSYSEEEDADDYLVTMPVKLEAGKSYKMTVSAANSYAGWYTETFEVLVGTAATASALTQTVLGTTEVDDDEFQDFDGSFSVSESGNYYVAIHCTSEADMSSLYVQTLSIEEEARATIAVGIDHAGYATFSSTQALDFSDVTAIKAYTATVDEDGTITFTEIKKVPAGTGVLLLNPAAFEPVAAINVPVIEDADADMVENNALMAVNTTIESLVSDEGDNHNYILNDGTQGIGFYRAAGQSVAAGKAYLRLNTTAEAPAFLWFNFDTLTGIKLTAAEGQNSAQGIYNLQGQKMTTTSGLTTLKKGVYVVNGRKVSVQQ